jgi:hypothetical protein
LVFRAARGQGGHQQGGRKLAEHRRINVGQSRPNCGSMPRAPPCRRPVAGQAQTWFNFSATRGAK